MKDREFWLRRHRGEEEGTLQRGPKGRSSGSLTAVGTGEGMRTEQGRGPREMTCTEIPLSRSTSNKEKALSSLLLPRGPRFSTLKYWPALLCSWSALSWVRYTVDHQENQATTHDNMFSTLWTTELQTCKITSLGSRGEITASKHEGPSWKDGHILKSDYGATCKTVNILKITELHT